MENNSTSIKSDPHITVDVTDFEVRTAIQRLKNRKTPGEDKINNELLKYGGEALHSQLTQLIQKVFRTSKIQRIVHHNANIQKRRKTAPKQL